MARTGLGWRALRFCAGVAVVGAAFVLGTAVVDHDTYLLRFQPGPVRTLDRPCAGVEAGTVTAAVPSPHRRVETLPDGWEWSCRWRSTDAATLHASNPTLYVRAERYGRYRGGTPTQYAAKTYGVLATNQFSDARFGEDDAEARSRGLGVHVLEGVGDRAQVYVEPEGVSTSGHRATALAVRGNVVVVAWYIAYRAEPGQVRTSAVAALREAVAAL